MLQQDKIKQFKYYRDVQLWPLADDLNYEEWLNNFADGEEREIAMCILDFFMYFPDSLVNQMLATVIGKCGYVFQRKRGGWDNDKFKTDCWYSYIPGEDMKTTDSGNLFHRKLRDNLGIPEERIIGYPELHQKLSTEDRQNVILVDDFVGSGHQTYVAWILRKLSGKSLAEWSAEKDHCVIYAPLVVNKMGRDIIYNDCPELELCHIHTLTEEFNLFNPLCPCWNGDRTLYRKAMDLIEKKSLSMGIPFSGGANVIDVQGYRRQGLALAFEHGMPDACPPIFYWETTNWKPLIRKVYQRP